MKTIEELQVEREKLQEHLKWGKDILVFEELNWVKNRIKEIEEIIA
ncbi:hypothetical protein QTG56_25640 (plasmid) [Rossellomorea sp. AcN35-11]|nr:hypothetical protein [Rossellomorea aquimaris]WJV31999.1 hypothetical protein QTG56_25640 [Rossellomorea sp. AcN35-11]